MDNNAEIIITRLMNYLNEQKIMDQYVFHEMCCKKQ